MSERRKYKVIVSDRAKQMLGVHIRFLAQVDKDDARNKKKELMEAMRSLAYSPNRFPFLNEPYIPCNKYHKMFVKNWYLILYQIEDDTVYVDYILDCRKEYNWLIRLTSSCTYLQLKCDMIATYLKMQRCIAGGEHPCIFYGYIVIQLK